MAQALVLFSGGQDSSTCLAWALTRFEIVETVGFYYGQRHSVELDCRDAVRAGIAGLNDGWARQLGQDHLLNLSAIGELGGSALTTGGEFKTAEGSLPAAFVPGRNIMFLTFAAAVAYHRGIQHLVGGMAEGPYPDCRDDTLKSLQVTLNLGMETNMVIHTPLMWHDKAGAWGMAEDLGGHALVDLIRTDTHTCYAGDRTMLHDWGYGCGTCPACIKRADGWQRYAARLADGLKHKATHPELPAKSMR